MALLYKNGRWVVDYYPEGRHGPRKKLRLPEFVTDEAEAREYEKEIRSLRSAARTRGLPREGATVKTLLEDYSRWYELHRSPSTVKDFELARKHFERILGGEKAENISMAHINLYKKVRMGDAGKRTINRSINKELSYFTAFLKWVTREGHITPRQIYVDKLPYKRPIPMVLSFEECLRIIQAAEPVYRAFFLCLYALGLRINEARNIRYGDIDHHNNTISVKQKGGTFKILPMPEIVTRAIKQIADPGASSKADEFVFLNKKKGKPIQDVRKAIARACEKAGITRHVNPHLFRHSFATHLVAEEINLRVIQRLLGHSQIAMTERYTQADISVLRKAGETLSKKLGTTGKRGQLLTGTTSRVEKGNKFKQEHRIRNQ
jgi:site-specific recombinase XerD